MPLTDLQKQHYVGVVADVRLRELAKLWRFMASEPFRNPDLAAKAPGLVAAATELESLVAWLKERVEEFRPKGVEARDLAVMEAGEQWRQKDAVIAADVMGLLVKEKLMPLKDGFETRAWDYWNEERQKWMRVLDYGSDDGAAMKIIDRLRTHWRLDVHVFAIPQGYRVLLMPDDGTAVSWRAEGDTLAPTVREASLAWLAAQPPQRALAASL